MERSEMKNLGGAEPRNAEFILRTSEGLDSSPPEADQNDKGGQWAVTDS